MAYDQSLADRIRELLAEERDLTEKKMFGGLAFLVGGNMAVAASGQGGAMVRVDPAQSESLVGTTTRKTSDLSAAMSIVRRLNLGDRVLKTGDLKGK